MTRIPTRTATSLPGYGVDVLRGALIGAAETVPGVSGGTVALIVRVYDTAITSVGHLLSGALRACTDLPRGRGWSRAAGGFRAVQWHVVLPLLLGMAGALLLMASLMAGWVEQYPVRTRALFFGLVLASLWVPFSMAGKARGNGTTSGWSWRDVGIAVLAAALAYIVVSLPPGDLEPTPPIIIGTAAVAVSALVLPGLSGSFLLMTVGLYQSTLAAVNERDIGYLALFALGALLGLASIVKLLQWLLVTRRRGTLVILTGLLAGSLRALWPWQDDDRTLLAPGDQLGSTATLTLAGFTAVAVTLVIERRVASRKAIS